MSDPFEIDFGSRDVANASRDVYDEYLAGDPDRRTTTVELEADAPESVLERASGQASLSREERATGIPGVELTEGEKSRLDFTETSVVEARQAKAKAAEQGVGDFISFFDPTLSVEENEELFESASRESSGGRDARRTPQSREASAFQTAESSMLEHARKGVRHGSQQAEQELRRRGVSEQEIQQLKREPAGRLDPRTEVLFPDVGTISAREWATAKRSHEHRRREAQHSDEGKRAEQVTSDVEQWRDSPNTFDFPGVDTKRDVGHWLEGEEEREFTALTDDLWPWQG